MGETGDDDFSLAETLGLELGTVGNEFIEGVYKQNLDPGEYDADVYTHTFTGFDVGHVHVEKGLLLMVPDAPEPRRLLREYTYGLERTIITDNIPMTSDAIPEEDVFEGSVSASRSGKGEGWEGYYAVIIA
ncbi:hypothetical protein [Natronolimnobius baerhuensis]|uniref:Uncharacterized protein n=1 Tax=Natronolimnobius baerhuensis TaxID=253108 RepID=A0A202E9Z0_9EURY|nr:hypothetical protein [Natronolimnobius baerhuensis]OVE85086.1 hypothetical protein B2G88_12125 [Natronolimnobius baerhuensis]